MKTIQKTYIVPRTTIHVISCTAPLMASGDPTSIPVDKDATPGDQSQADSRRWRNNLWDDDEEGTYY